MAEKKEKFKVKLSLKLRMFLSISIVLLIIISAIMVSVVTLTKESLLENAKDSYTSLTARHGELLKGIYTDMDRILFQISNSNILGKLLLEEQLSVTDKINVATNIVQEIDKYTFEPLTTQRLSYSIVLLVDSEFPAAQYIMACDEKSVFTPYLHDARIRVYSDANLKQSSHILDEITNTGRSFVFLTRGQEAEQILYFGRCFSSAYVNSRGNPRLAGRVVFAFHSSVFHRILQSSLVTGNSFIALYSSNEKVFSYGDNTDLEKILLRKAKDSEAKRMNEIRQKGQVYWGISWPVYNNFTLVSVIPQADILASMWQKMRVLLFLFIPALLLAFLLSIVLSWRIHRPIGMLAQAMRSVGGEGDLLKIQWKYFWRDEISLLYESYNLLLQRIQHLLIETKERSRKIQEAELKALEAQINPHFIYNTLNAVNCVALPLRDQRISKMVTSLSSIIRYSIKDMDSLVSLRDELSVLDKYLAIERLRYENELVVTRNIDSNLLDCQMPKLILQPLVENSILYSVEKGQIFIHIEAKTEGANVVVSIMDRGKAGVASHLNEILHHNDDWGDYMLTSSRGLGIQNVQKRIRLHFGMSFGLHYRDTEKGLCAQITLPHKQ